MYFSVFLFYYFLLFIFVVCVFLGDNSNFMKFLLAFFFFRKFNHLHISIISSYYMARACKYITRAAIGQYSGPDFPAMPTGIASNVNAWLVKREYRKCEST